MAYVENDGDLYKVAPCTGAWIEMIDNNHVVFAENVAPCTGAWIEIIKIELNNTKLVKVAPCTGAWIEI